MARIKRMAIEVTSTAVTSVGLLLLLMGCYISYVSCSEISDELGARCDIVDAKFVAANCVKALWISQLSTQERIDKDRLICEITLTEDTCENPIQQYEAEIINSTDTNSYSHSFWIDNTSDRKARSYTVCARIVKRSDDGTSKTSIWQSQIIHAIARQPPFIKKCSVFTGNEVNRIAFDKREVYLYSRGDNITFSCSVEGKPFPKIRWCKNTVHCANGVTSNQGVLNLPSAEKQDEGIYVALVENDYGRVLSTGMHIRQSVLGEFEGDSGPTLLSHKKGDSFLLNCRAPVSVPAPDIGWVKTTPNAQKNTIHFDQRIVLGLDGSLIILNAEVSDEGKYACKVRNRVLDESQESRETDVTVHDGTTFRVQPIIQNKNSPNEDTILGLVGESMKLQCVFSGRPQPQVQWFKDRVPVQDQRFSRSVDGYTLTIYNLTKADEGSYRCLANNSEGSNHFIIKLIVHETPRIVSALISQNVTVGDAVNFTCKGDGIPRPKTDWIIDGKSMSEDTLRSLNGSISPDKSRITIRNVGLQRTCNVQCNVTNDYGYALSTAYLNVFLATVIVQDPSILTKKDRDFVLLGCAAETDARSSLYFTWSDGNSSIVSDDVYTVYGNGSLRINFTGPKQMKWIADNYTCVAYNGLSSDSRTLSVHGLFEDKQSLHSVEIVGFVGAISFAILVLVLITIMVILCLRRSKHQRLRPSSPFATASSMAPALSYTSHGELGATDSHECLMCENDWCSRLMPLNDRLKAAIRQMYIPKERLELQKIIGKGQFGRVYAALLRDPRDIVEQVAVKTMKYKPDESEMVELFLKEAVIMKDFQHINVLGIRGITFDADNSPMVILPYMANGDLRKHILQPDLDVTILQLLVMGLQVARGMQYLSQMRFVHRDLAARNCMVNERGIVKVADFGLSRQLLVRDYYRVESNGTTPVPVRWMAPECLEANLFTTMSDVWSFGVLLWELMTRGAVPYPDVENWQISNHVQSGKRLGQPLYCPDIVFAIMQSCWEVEQQNRPSFKELVESIQNVIQSAKPGARMSSLLYQNIVQTGSLSSDSGKGDSSLDYRL